LKRCCNLTELTSSSNQLKAFEKFDLQGFSELKELTSFISNSRIWFVRVFQVEKTTFIYWSIDCTLKAWFVKVSQHNYLHLLAYWMHSKILICHGVSTWKNYFHLLQRNPKILIGRNKYKCRYCNEAPKF